MWCNGQKVGGVLWVVEEVLEGDKEMRVVSLFIDRTEKRSYWVWPPTVGTVWGRSA